MKRKPRKQPDSPGCGRTAYIVVGLAIFVAVACSVIDFPGLFNTAVQQEVVDPKSTTSEDAQAKLNASVNLDELNKLAMRKQPPVVYDNWLRVSRSIPTMKWVNGSSLTRAVKSGKPAVLKHKDIMSWSIFDLNLLELSEKVVLHLNGTRWQPEPVFVLGQEREKGGMLGSPKDQPLSYTNVTLSQFVAATFDEHNWLYWTGELAYWDSSINSQTDKPSTTPSPAVDGAFHDWRDFRIKEQGLAWDGNNATNAEIDEKEDVWRPMLWLSHPGVVAQTHYDTQHNVFVQVLGSKRFFLFAPKTELYAYPNIHRSYRQSQVRFEESNYERFPHVTRINTTAYEVVLHPGDVLYIPPYWHHRVESLTLAVSLSILSPSYVEASLAEVFWENVPFGAFQAKRGLRTRAVQLYLSLLMEKVENITSNATLQDFAQSVYAFRFATLDVKHKPFATCYEHEVQRSDATSHSADVDSTNPDSVEGMEALLKTHEAKFRSAARNVGNMLLRIDADNAIKVTFLRDYMEQLVRWAVGPDYTASFVKSCLA